MITTTPSKLNNVKPGDRVKIKKSIVAKHCEGTFIVDMYAVPTTNELSEDVFPEIHFWLTHYLKHSHPRGKVIGFGATEDDNDRLNVKVRFRHLGKDLDIYFHEKNMVKL